MHGKWLDGLSDDESKSVSWYTADGYGDINDFLRKRSGWEHINPNINGSIKHIDSAISKFELKESITVQRGVEDFYGAYVVYYVIIPKDRRQVVPPRGGDENGIHSVNRYFFILHCSCD